MFMREKISVPLGMTKTRDRDLQFVIPLRANGYEWNENRCGRKPYGPDGRGIHRFGNR